MIIKQKMNTYCECGEGCKPKKGCNYRPCECGEHCKPNKGCNFKKQSNNKTLEEYPIIKNLKRQPIKSLEQLDKYYTHFEDLYYENKECGIDNVYHIYYEENDKKKHNPHYPLVTIYYDRKNKEFIAYSINSEKNIDEIHREKISNKEGTFKDMHNLIKKLYGFNNFTICDPIEISLDTKLHKKGTRDYILEHN